MEDIHWSCDPITNNQIQKNYHWDQDISMIVIYEYQIIFIGELSIEKRVFVR